MRNSNKAAIAILIFGLIFTVTTAYSGWLDDIVPKDLQETVKKATKTVKVIKKEADKREKTKAKSTYEYSNKKEYYLGRSVAATIVSNAPYIEHRFVDYINEVGQYVAMHSSRPTTYIGYRFGIIASNTPNAVATPGGTILLTTSLIKHIESEEELAGILAHEIGHIAERHTEKTLQDMSAKGLIKNDIGRALLAAQALTNKKEIGKALVLYEKTVDDVTDVVLNKPHSREQESEADTTAIESLAQSTYDPNGLISFLSRQKSSGGLLSTHPSDDDRIAKLKSLAKGRKVSSTSKARDSRFKKEKAAFLKHIGG